MDGRLFRPTGVAHDRSGSRRHPLCGAGVWPRGRPCRRQGLHTRGTGRCRDPARGADQDRDRPGRQIGGDAEDRRRRGLQEERFPQRSRAARPDRHHRAGRQRQLAASGPHHLPDQAGGFPRKDLPAGARHHGRLHRLSAGQRRGGGRCAGRAGAGFRQSLAVASGSRHAAAVARPARGGAGARAIREAARPARLPPAGLFDRFGFGLAPRLSRVLRGARQARRFHAVSRARRHRQAGADLRGQAALRRGAQAWRALRHQPARGSAVHREGEPAEIGRVQHLCPRPQAIRAFHRPRLCAAAHRPARHSAGQRQHPGSDGEDFPDRRPQPDQHRDRRQFPAQPVEL